MNQKKIFLLYNIKKIYLKGRRVGREVRGEEDQRLQGRPGQVLRSRTAHRSNSLQTS